MNIAPYIDHTVLKPDADEATVRRYCREALDYGFASVCVNSAFVPLVSSLLKGSEVKTCSVVGFPLGAMISEAKRFETEAAVSAGAEEIDMVINIGALKDKKYDIVQKEIEQIVRATAPGIVKVIIETCLLTDEEKVIACRLSVDAGAAFVKTSTGFSGGGALLSDILLMKKTVENRARIKASGGIRTYEQAKELIDGGAQRIGAGNGLLLLK